MSNDLSLFITSFVLCGSVLHSITTLSSLSAMEQGRTHIPVFIDCVRTIDHSVAEFGD
ncbi:hypothetical protein DOT_0948 [Desulfosporosinus sp. OT]|nr:hypothetical protein DOT_0948 [Desulfosporosinus sp. OT]